MQVFYVNIGGGEPTVRRDFWELVDYAVDASRRGEVLDQRHAGSHRGAAARLARTDYVDVQVSLDGATARGQRPVRGAGSYATALARDGATSREAGFARLQAVGRRHARRTCDQLDAFKALADGYGAQLRLTRLRPSGPRRRRRGTSCIPPPAQQRELYEWLLAHGDERPHRRLVLPPRAPTGSALPGLNLCGAGRVVCLIDPIGDVYACPFVIHDEFLAGNVRDRGGFARVWRESELFAELRRPQTRRRMRELRLFDACRGGCMAAKFFTGLPLEGPDPECVLGHGERLLAARGDAAVPRPSVDHVATAVRQPCTARRVQRAARPRRPGAVAAFARSVVRDGRGGPAARRSAAAAVGVLRARRRLRGGRHARRQRRGVRRARVRAPRRRTSPAQRDLSDDGAWGRRSRCRCCISPTGVQAVHPDGEVAVARAAAARGTAMGLSSFAQQADRGRSWPRTRRRSSRCTGPGARERIAARIERAPRPPGRSG